MQLNYLSFQIIEAALNVHRTLGPGLLESVYQQCMSIELQEKGLEVQTEVDLPVTYRNKQIEGLGYRLDLVVENRVIVELKSVEQIKKVHKKQLLTYLRLSNKELGLLLNFNVPVLKEGIVRIANSRKDKTLGSLCLESRQRRDGREILFSKCRPGSAARNCH